MTKLSDDQIDRLVNELELTRFQVIDMAPGEFGRLLRGHDHKFHDEDDLWAWQKDVVEAVIDAAIKATTDRYNPRAACPLCRSLGSSWRESEGGWLVPNGLAMHLEGIGRAESCPVIEIAFKLLRNRHRETFNATEQAKQDAHAARLKTDPVLLIDPHREPVLAATTHYSSDAARPPDAWPAIEARLREIGFAIEKTGNVTTYKYMIGEDWMILADPRIANSVEFAIFKRSGKYRWKSIANYIRLQDRWKDWPGKFRERLLTKVRP
jgi:hypothetical protein